MKVPFMDLRMGDDTQRKEILDAIETVFLHGRLLLGPEVEKLENTIAAYCRKKYAVGVGSGSMALLLALKSLGLASGDEVITTSLSWIATANAIALAGAVPVFADTGDDLNIDPDSVEKLVTERTKAILPVHYTGKVCRMTALEKIADTHGLAIIEDASQAFGAEYNSEKAGSFGDIACFSLNPMKIFAACGEAGIILTDEKEIYESLLALRHNGMVDRILCSHISTNGRIDTVQAACLLKRFKYLDANVERRRQIAAQYTSSFKAYVSVPIEKEPEKDIYYTYTIKTKKRDELKSLLESKGIETQIQHPIIMPEQPAFKKTAKGQWHNAKRLSKRILCLPVNEGLTDAQVDYVIKSVYSFFKG